MSPKLSWSVAEEKPPFIPKSGKVLGKNVCDRKRDRERDRNRVAPRSHAFFCSPRTSSTESILCRFRNLQFELLICTVGCKYYSGFIACVHSGKPSDNCVVSVGQSDLTSCWKSHLEVTSVWESHQWEALPLVLKGTLLRVVKTVLLLERVTGSHLCSSATGSLCPVQGSR